MKIIAYPWLRVLDKKRVRPSRFKRGRMRLILAFLQVFAEEPLLPRVVHSIIFKFPHVFVSNSLEKYMEMQS